MRRAVWLSSLILPLLLVGCGLLPFGGGNDDPAAPVEADPAEGEEGGDPADPPAEEPADPTGAEEAPADDMAEDGQGGGWPGWHS
ncbi:MAG: hypothetical protein GYB68_13675, partial [Chloroflexi bacterium]|nr:hypothetical protein [Chloroflexota bacterium]